MTSIASTSETSTTIPTNTKEVRIELGSPGVEPRKEDRPDISAQGLTRAVDEVVTVLDAVTDVSTSLSFSIDEDLSRMVVSVRAVGSDEIIRQFPPEEFITVAKFIAAQNPDDISEDFLKGILFDQYS